MKQLSRSTLLFVMATLCVGHCFAPVKGTLSPGMRALPKATEADLERFQSMGVHVLAHKGELPKPLHNEVQAGNQDPAAAAVLGTVLRHQERSANEALREARRQLDGRQENGKFSWPFALLLAVSGLAVVTGMRSYANRVMPLDKRGRPLKRPKVWK
jgi:hypothetical protein